MVALPATCDGPTSSSRPPKPMAETLSYLRLAAGSGTTLADQVRPASRLAIDVRCSLQARSFSPLTDRSRCGVTRFAMGAGPIAAVTYWRWRDALFEGPFRQSLGRTEFAEPSRDRACGLSIAWSRNSAHPPPTLILRSQAAVWPCGFTHRLSRGAPSTSAVCSFSVAEPKLGAGGTVFAIKGFSPIAGAAATIHLYANPLATDFSSIMRTFHGDSPHASRSVHVLRPAFRSSVRKWRASS